ncbi:MAG: DUF2892 domain-containing protein [Rhodomicrobiaceae bacterium]
MRTNVGVLDGAFRLCVGIALLALSYGKIGPHLSHNAAWIVWTVGAVFAFTGLFRYCPIYALMGTDSCAPYPGDDRR